MAAGSAARTIRAPGRMVVDPTQEFDGGTFPYGGTEVGYVNLVTVLPLGEAFVVEYESTGEAGAVLEPDNRYAMSFFLRGWDDDALEHLLGNHYEEGAVSQHAGWTAPGELLPGASADARIVKLAFVPDDPINVPGVMVYAGVAWLAAGAEVRFQRDAEVGLPVRVECMRDSSNRIIRINRLVDLAVT